ncbi:MAG: pyridoxamine 5'-phosphate oxidase family protein, partial [Pseudomonadota bacterium]
PAERVLKVEVVAMDWNCPKYIPTLYSGAAIQEVIGPKMAALQAENEELRAEIERLKREA